MIKMVFGVENLIKMVLFWFILCVVGVLIYGGLIVSQLELCMFMFVEVEIDQLVVFVIVLFDQLLDVCMVVWIV